MPNEQRFFSHGKLLITGEYLVLNGAKALAIPTIKGQSLTVQKGNQPTSEIEWMAYNVDHSVWFETKINYKKRTSSNSNAESQSLLKIFNHPLVQNALSDTNSDFRIQTQLQFPKEWGWGTSSTLINNIAQWLEIDAYLLQKDIFGGSGYDIACAQRKEPIQYQVLNEVPRVSPAQIHSKIQPHLYFIYLNEKQNSREAIQQFQQKEIRSKDILAISEITERLSGTENIEIFIENIQLHTHIMENILQQKSAQQQFADAAFTIKNLGAWGGDFIMAVSTEDPTSYFAERGYTIVLKYQDIFS